MIFTTDDYWPYETMKKNASRLRVRDSFVWFLVRKRLTLKLLQVLSVPDLSPPEAFNALRYLRSCYGPSRSIDKEKEKEQIPQVLHLLGGRISLLLRAAKANDMLGEYGNNTGLARPPKFMADYLRYRGSSGHARCRARMDNVEVRSFGLIAFNDIADISTPPRSESVLFPIMTMT